MSEEPHQPEQKSKNRLRAGGGEVNPDMLRVARGAQGKTQSELAKAVSKWEDGSLVPSDNEIEQIARHLRADQPATIYVSLHVSYCTLGEEHRLRETDLAIKKALREHGG